MIKNFLDNRKGAFTDLFVAMISMFMFAIIVVLFVYAGNLTRERLLEVAPTIQATLGDENATEIIEGTFGMVVRSFTAFRWITVMLFMGLLFSIMLSGYLVTVKPIFFVPYIFIVIIAIIVAAPLSNAYERISQDPVLAETFSGFWGQNYIFANLPIWIAVVGILAGIIMYVNMERLKDAPRF